MTLLLQNKTKDFIETAQSFRVQLDDGLETTVHVARYVVAKIRPRVVLFEKETSLLEWCERHEVSNAMGGGFFLRGQGLPLGDMWINGRQQKTASFASPWSYSRGSCYVSPVGGLSIAPRYLLPQRPQSDILQAGPLLVQNYKSMVPKLEDPEGFSEAAYQFDSDITVGRYPRSAIGINKEFIFSIACDGRSVEEAGLSLDEFAQVLREIGVSDALNLDGGSSATIISDRKLINNPRSDTQLYSRGRPIFSAIVFDKA